MISALGRTSVRIATCLLGIAIACAGAGACAQKPALPSAEVDACLHSAARKYAVSYELLRAIAEQESRFNAAAIGGTNANGSRDHGLMQINDAWLPQLARFNIQLADLYRPCVNAEVGAWILAQNIRDLGLTWNAVGAYNAASPGKRQAYASAIYQRLLHQAVASLPQTQQIAGASSGAMGVWEGDQ